jgi:LmbE family N-acetylglucosaminyl deacetylase
VANAAGFEPTIFWREDNRAFRMRDELVKRLRDTLGEIRPALVFSPFLADVHPDHLTLNRILAAALEQHAGDGMTVIGYEVWSLVPANLWCDVTSCMADLERLLWLYPTAMMADDFIHMCSSRNRYHARTLGRSGYAEAFFATDVPRFRDLVERR